MSAQFIFTMHKVSRFYPPDREVLKDITLSFYPGAKIGVLGRQRLGQVVAAARSWPASTTDFTGEARLSPGFTVGLLEQEPHLDPSKDVHRQRHGRRRRDGHAARALRRGAGQVGRSRRRLREARRASRPSSSARSRRAGAWDLKRTIEIAMDALRLPAGDADVDDAVRRRASPRGAVPAAAERARPAAARRAHQPPRRRVGRLARALPAATTRHRRRHHPRPLLPRQRGPVDPRARPRPGHPLRGQLQLVARAEAGAPPPGGEGTTPARQRTLERELEWVRMAPKARQAKGKARLAAYEKLLAEAKAADGRADKLEIVIPSGRAPRRRRDRGRARRARATATGCSSTT